MNDWFTAAEIASLMGWSVGYVHRLACRDGWRRLGTRPQKYLIHDVTKMAA